MGKSSINGPFSMAMLNNQRVYCIDSPKSQWTFENSPKKSLKNPSDLVPLLPVPVTRKPEGGRCPWLHPGSGELQVFLGKTSWKIIGTIGKLQPRLKWKFKAGKIIYKWDNHL